RSVLPTRLASAIGIQQSAAPMAAMLAGLVGPLIGVWFGWRWAFVVLGVATLVALAAFHGRPEPSGSPKPDIRRASTPKYLVTIAVGASFAVAAPLSLTAFLVDYATTLGFSPTVGGLLLTIGGLGTIAVRIVAGYWADRSSGTHLRAVSGLLLMGSVGYFLIAIPIPWLLPVGVLVALSLAWGTAGLVFLSVIRLSPDAAASAVGSIVLATSLGAIVAPVLIGVVAENISYSVAWLLAASWVLIGAGLMALGARMVRRQGGITFL
ncbi:MAG TPA: MFS transporter, partial [Terrimesophilobacter sp.]|nr:MFS transporter [Terrimesophilobacter sp.]